MAGFSQMSLYRVLDKPKILAMLNNRRTTTMVLAKFLKVTYNHLNWITITKDLDAHSLILSSQHSDPKWSNHNEAKIDGETWLLISFRSESFIFTLGEEKVDIFQSTILNISTIMWHGRQRKAFLFHPNISPKVVTYLLFPKVLILDIFSFFSLVSVRYMCSCGWCDEENGLYDPNKWLCL